MKMRGAISPLPQYAFMAWCSVKAQGQLYIYLTKEAKRLSKMIRVLLFGEYCQILPNASTVTLKISLTVHILDPHIYT
jgi:hypothetical protein